MEIFLHRDNEILEAIQIDYFPNIREEIMLKKSRIYDHRIVKNICYFMSDNNYLEAIRINVKKHKKG